MKYMQTGGLTEISPQASTFAPTLGRATKVDGLDVLLLPDGNVVDARTRQPVPPLISQKARGKLRPPSGGEVFDPTRPTLSQVSSGDIGMNEAQLLDEEMRQAALEGGVNPSYDYSQMMQDQYGIGISDRMSPPPAVDVRDRGEISPLSAPDAPRQPPTLSSVGVGVGLQDVIEGIPEEGLPLGVGGSDDELPFVYTQSASRPDISAVGDIPTVSDIGELGATLSSVAPEPKQMPLPSLAAPLKLDTAPLPVLDQTLEATLAELNISPEDFAALNPEDRQAILDDPTRPMRERTAGMYPAGEAPFGTGIRQPGFFLETFMPNKAADIRARRYDQQLRLKEQRATADEDVEAAPSTPEELEEAMGLGSDDAVTPPSGPVTLTEPGGTGGGTGGGVSAAALSDAERAFNQDKWLALAKVGFTLMSSTLPIGMALGQAGSAGVAAFQAARKTYEDAKLAQQALAAKRSGRSGRSKLLPAGAVDMFDSEIESLEYELSTAPTPARKVEITNRLKQLRGLREELRGTYLSQYFGGLPSRGQQTGGSSATDVRD